MHYRKLFLFLLFSPACCIVSGQKQYLYFRKITTQDGLSHNKVNCILQDRRGFMWVGTDDGLNRYDGKYFTTFRHLPGDTTTLSGNIVTDLLEDKEGLIWVATADGGISRYNYKLSPHLQFKQFRHLPDDSLSIPVNIINDLLEDEFGYLWFATNGKGVIRFDKRTERFEMPAQSRGGNVAALCLDNQKELWVGRQGGGLMKVNTETLLYASDPRYRNLYAKLPHAAISSLFRDRANNIWYGSWDRILYKYDAAFKKEEAFKQTASPTSFPDDDILSFAQDSSGRLWLGGRYNGLTLYDVEKNAFYNFKNDPSKEGTVADNTINCIFIDRSGQTWLGTNKGISIYDAQKQIFVQEFLPHHEKDLTIYDFYKDARQRLWIGTSDGLFIRKKDGSYEHPKLSYKGHHLLVSSFFPDIDGSLYIGTNFSLFQIDKENFSLKLLPNTERDPVVYNIIDSRVVSVIRDSINDHPALLVSPFGHFLAYYDLHDKIWVSRSDSSRAILSRFNIKDNLIRRLYHDKSGGMMMATQRFGLGISVNDTAPRFEYYHTNPSTSYSISNDNVYDIAPDTSNAFWVATYGGGLNKYDVATQQFTHIAGSSNLLEGLTLDNNGKLWMISNGSLHQYDPITKSFSTFTLPDLEKSGGVKGYIYKDENGVLYVAGVNFYISFDPLKVKPVIEEPHIYLTDFRIFSTSYSDLIQQKTIELNHNQNYFTVEFSSPEYRTGEVEYSYKLEGIDKDWVESGARNIASYSNLRGGTYRFVVRASNRKGVWSREGAVLNISIIPPFWERWWFYAMVVILAAGAIYALYRYRINELLKMQAIRNRIAQDLHDNVGSTLSSISVYSQVAKIYKQQEKEEGLDDTLERIGSASSEMISEMNDIVWAINPRNDSMGRILQRMESYAKPLLRTKGISFNFNYDPDIAQLNLGMEQRKNFYLIFKEAIANTLKYSGASCVYTTVSISHRRIELTVKDDGCGFEIKTVKTESQRSLSGNGLGNMKRRAKDMKGECQVQSVPGAGTTITLNFPIT